MNKQLSKRALKCSPDFISRVSPETGKLMEHLGDNVYRDTETGKIYKATGTVSNQTKQDTLFDFGPGIGQLLYPKSA